MQKVKTSLVICLAECVALIESLEVHAGLKEGVKEAQATVKTEMENVILPKVNEGYVIPVKSTEEARSDYKTLRKVMFPQWADKKQKDYTSAEKSLNSSLNFAWNSILIPSAKEVASCFDAEKLLKVANLLNSSLEDGQVYTDLNDLVKRCKTSFDLKDSNGLKLLNEAVQECVPARKRLISDKVLEAQERLETLQKEQEELESVDA